MMKDIHLETTSNLRSIAERVQIELARRDKVIEICDEINALYSKLLNYAITTDTVYLCNANTGEVLLEDMMSIKEVGSPRIYPLELVYDP